MLFQTPVLDPRETKILEQIDELKKQLGYATSTPSKRWNGLLRRNAFAKAIRGSNSIEGYNINADDAIAAAEGEAPLDAEEATWLAVMGYRRAMTYVLTLANDPYFGYSTDLLRSLHFMMIDHEPSKNPGKWRPGPIYVHDEERDVRVYEGPAAETVPPLMRELVSSFTTEDGTPSLVRAAMAHLNLVMIHPFSDGNGRMARCLQTLVLARNGTLSPEFCSIEEYLGSNTQPYYDVLAAVGGGAWHPENDCRQWIRFCLTAHYRQAMTLLIRSREIGDFWTRIEEHVSRIGLSDRTVPALVDAAMGYRVRNPTYRAQADVSEQVAGKDLKELVDHDLLLPHGEKRGRYYLRSPMLESLVSGLRQSRRIPDPFEAAS